MSTPSGMIDYPFRFEVRRRGLLCEVVSIEQPQRTARKAAGPFFSYTTALRVAEALTQYHRTGWDCGAKGRAVYGGGRFA